MAGSWLKRFYERPDFVRTHPAKGARDVIRWWESRRLFYNLVVGTTGAITCAMLVVCAVIADSLVGEPIGMPDGPLLGVFMVVLYALLANVCYTAGWISELLVRTVRTADDSCAFALRTFRMGITFSIFLTLSPAALCWLAFAVALMKGQKHGLSDESARAASSETNLPKRLHGQLSSSPYPRHLYQSRSSKVEYATETTSEQAQLVVKLPHWRFGTP